MPTDLASLFNPINKPEIKPKTIQLDGHLGRFLGDIERNQFSIALRGDPGAGKTRLSYQIKNILAGQKLTVGSFSLEISKHSDIVSRMKDEYLSPANQKYISISDEAPEGIETIRKAAKYFDVIVIDSWGKLKCKQEEFDRLRKDFPNTFFIVIFQSTTAGTSRGGVGAEYDAGIVMQVNEGGLAVCEKNRYSGEKLTYNVFTKKIEEDHE